MPNTIKKCNCRSSFQDAKYGDGYRVMTVKMNDKGCTCTVCGTEHRGSGDKKK